jgi:hypothetical protein
LGAVSPRTCQTRFNAEDAMAFVQERGVVLASAKGNAPNLVEAIVGQPVSGSWWAHPEAKHIYATLCAVTESEEVLVCRLVGGKITLVHRRLWPALARLADRFLPEQISWIRQEYTAAGRHVSHAVLFPEWVPRTVMEEAGAFSDQEALAVLAAWLPSPGSSTRVQRPSTRRRKIAPFA